MYNNYSSGYMNNSGYTNGYGSGYGNYTDDYDDIGIDLSQTERYAGDVLLPDGEYTVRIKNAQRKHGNNDFIRVTYIVTNGEYKGCCISESFFLWSDKEFPKTKFKALRYACGLNPNVGGKVSELFGKEFLAGVKRQGKYDSNTRSRTDELENVISAYFPLNPSQTQFAQTSQAPQPMQAPRPMQAPTVQHPAAPQPMQAPQPAQAPQRPAPAAPQTQAQNVQPSEYAQDMQQGPQPQEATFPTPEKGSMDDTPF